MADPLKPTPVGKDVEQADSDVDRTSTSDEQARALLRTKNCREFRSSLSFPGRLVWPNGKAIQSGSVVNFKNKGFYDGRWIIEIVKHVLSDNRLTTELELRRCIDAATFKTLQGINSTQPPEPDPTTAAPFPGTPDHPPASQGDRPQ